MSAMTSLADDAKCYCPLDGLVASVLRFVSLAVAHLLLRPGFVEPSPQDLEVLLLHRPSRDNGLSKNQLVTCFA